MSRKSIRTTKAIPLFDLEVSTQTKQLVQKVLSGGWLSTGSIATQFETEISRLIAVPHVAAVSSATAGLIASLKAANIGRGDEVIVPSYTFIATAEAVTSVGATVRFADIHREYWSLDPVCVEGAITKQTRAVIPVDFAGVPADYPRLRALARDHRLKLISDSSHALGATLRYRPISSYTDFSVISLHVTKNLTSAEGGLVLSRTAKDDSLIRMISRHGITRNAWQRRAKGAVEYDVIADGLKGNLPDLLAAVALGELLQFGKRQKQRTELAARYQSNLADHVSSIQIIRVPAHSSPSWHLFPISLLNVKTVHQRNQVLESLRKQGIECGIHYRPLHQMTLFRGHPDRKRLPVTDQLGRSVLVLPLYPMLSLSQIDVIVSRLIRVLRSQKL